MQVVTLTAEQSNQVTKLRNAQWMLTQARNEIQAALGDTDVGDGYRTAIEDIQQDLQLDIDSIGRND